MLVRRRIHRGQTDWSSTARNLHSIICITLTRKSAQNYDGRDDDWPLQEAGFKLDNEVAVEDNRHSRLEKPWSSHGTGNVTLTSPRRKALGRARANRRICDDCPCDIGTARVVIYTSVGTRRLSAAIASRQGCLLRAAREPCWIMRVGTRGKTSMPGMHVRTCHMLHHQLEDFAFQNLSFELDEEREKRSARRC